MSNFVSTKEAAVRAGYKNDSTIRHAIRNGWLKATKISRDWLVDESDLQAWLDNGRRVYPKISEEKTNS